MLVICRPALAVLDAVVTVSRQPGKRLTPSVRPQYEELLYPRVLAESDFFEPLTINSLVVPGYGGRSYYPTNTGFLTLQVRPAAAGG